MSEKINIQNSTNPERPDVSPEQMHAFRQTYSQLMKKALETNAVFMGQVIEPSKEILHIGESLAEQTGQPFIPNGNGSSVIVESDLGEVYGWIYSHDEALTGESGKLGSFCVTTTESGDEQDHYEFYPDGNIEKLHWRYGSQEKEDTTEHVSWLGTEETRQLGLQIEDAHLEFRHI